MVLKRINNFSVILIILCSTSFYNFSILGPVQKIAELLGVGLMLVVMLLHMVYSTGEERIKRNFNWPISLIILSLVTSMLMAALIRDQSLAQSIFAQRAMYFYLIYFLLHQLKLRPKDLERIFIAFGILYICLYLLQYFAYPKILFDAYVREDRGTIRIYMSGGNYLTVTLFIMVQRFLRTNRIKYLAFVLIILSVIVINAGRQSMAVMALVIVLFVLFDRKVKSKLFLVILGLISAFAIFVIFQDIFEALLIQSRRDATLGEDYIRFKAISYYLTEFFKHPMSYLMGNGAAFESSAYGMEIEHNKLFHRFFLSDIGLIGNYVIYGAFFILGVVIICIRSLRMKIEAEYIYIKYMFIAVILALFTSGAFAHADYIVFFGCVLYMLDVSKQNLKQNKLTEAKNR